MAQIDRSGEYQIHEARPDGLLLKHLLRRGVIPQEWYHQLSLGSVEAQQQQQHEPVVIVSSGPDSPTSTSTSTASSSPSPNSTDHPDAALPWASMEVNPGDPEERRNRQRRGSKDKKEDAVTGEEETKKKQQQQKRGRRRRRSTGDEDRGDRLRRLPIRALSADPDRGSFSSRKGKWSCQRHHRHHHHHHHHHDGKKQGRKDDRE